MKGSKQRNAFRYFLKNIGSIEVTLKRGSEVLAEGTIADLHGSGKPSTRAKVGKTEFRIDDIKKLSVRKRIIWLK
jgi:hypothetical protein